MQKKHSIEVAHARNNHCMPANLDLLK